MPVDSRYVTAKTDISKCLSLLFGKLKLCFFLVFHHVMIVATYCNLGIIEGCLVRNAKIKISIKYEFQIRRPLTTVTLQSRECHLKSYIV